MEIRTTLDAESIICENVETICVNLEASSSQYVIARKNQEISILNVQAFISNISVPKSLEELQWFIHESGCFNLEDVLRDDYLTWTAPRWAKPGDIVLFMHAKYAHTSLTAMRTRLKSKIDGFSADEENELMEWINRGLELHRKYGGKIFAIGRVCGMPEVDESMFDDDREILHWGSKISADIDKVFLLENPVDISDFNSFIMVSRQSGITPVFGSEYDKLREIIMKKNCVSDYFKESISTPLPLSKIDEKTWIKLSNEYRRSFMLEKQFRIFYVDYLLRELSDIKKIYKECRCKKTGIADSFIDNVIKFKGKYLPVEVKLSINAESNIKGQVRKYCYDDAIILDNKDLKIVSDKNMVIQNKVLIIDTMSIFLFDYDNNEINKLWDLDDLKEKKDIKLLEGIIYKAIFNREM